VTWAFRALGGSATLSVTDRCRDGAVIAHLSHIDARIADHYCSHREIYSCRPEALQEAAAVGTFRWRHDVNMLANAAFVNAIGELA
jgi:hypothetical protein